MQDCFTGSNIQLPPFANKRWSQNSLPIRKQQSSKCVIPAANWRCNIHSVVTLQVQHCCCALCGVTGGAVFRLWHLQSFVRLKRRNKALDHVDCAKKCTESFKTLFHYSLRPVVSILLSDCHPPK